MMNEIDSMTNIDLHRQEFPGLANKVYFNFGGQGTMPKAALEAIIDAHKYIQRHGPFSLKVNSWIAKRNQLTRETIAQTFSTNPQTITLTENVTTGCNIPLWGIDWKPEDQILITDCEHPGVIAIVKEISRRFQVEVITLPILATLNQGDPLTVIESHLTPKTRLLVLSHILWNTGQVLPLKDIVSLCHNFPSHSIPILVDGAQSVGILPLNFSELGADFYAFTGHKWLCGPFGVGGLYVRPEIFEQIHPTFVGWRSVITDENDYPIGWKPNGQRFEVATSSYPQYEGLKGAIATLQQWGDPQIRYERICHLSAYLWEKLNKLNGVTCVKNTPPLSGLVSFQITSQNNSHHNIVKSLEEQGFFLRTISHPNCIRACVHYFTLEGEIDQLIETIKIMIN
jgi:L-cysteine/cystine lyase